MTSPHQPTNLTLALERRGQGFPVLCLHGHPGSKQCMGMFTDFLAQDFLTIAPDLRGYGHSQVRSAFAMADHLEDLVESLDQEKISRCLILGWSLGGILALEMALRHPQRVSGLILIATAAFPRSDHPPISWQDNLYTGLAGLINWVVPGWRWNIRTWGQRSLFRYLLGQQTPAAYHYLAKAAVPAYLKTSRYAQQALNQAIQMGYNQENELAKITVPCLVLAGALDRHIIPAASKATAQGLSQSRWICYENTAHLFPWEIPDRVQGDIENWLEDYPDVCQ
ncbi:MAG: alpha/beta hydrolase [Acaryochloridaceae cyanobacterium SU_2_1]|nr:alpha/beta hydrolase [Acaryochloridaceae cyanobacterium SU_2_1]